MNCRFLIGRHVRMCSAVEGSLVLSSDELAGLCQSGAYPSCKVYQRCRQRGGRMPWEEYQRDYLTLKPRAPL